MKSILVLSDSSDFSLKTISLIDKYAKNNNGIVNVLDIKDITFSSSIKNIKEFVTLNAIDLIVYAIDVNRKSYLINLILNLKIKKLIKQCNIPVMLLSDSCDTLCFNEMIYVSNVLDEDFKGFSKFLLLAKKIKAKIHLININRDFTDSKVENVKFNLNLMFDLIKENKLDYEYHTDFLGTKKIKILSSNHNKFVNLSITNSSFNDLFKINSYKEIKAGNLIVF